MKKIYEKIKIQKIRNIDFNQSSKNAKIILFLYNSTGILECLALNIPFICYWPDTKKQINPLLSKKFDILKKNYHLSYPFIWREKKNCPATPSFAAGAIARCVHVEMPNPAGCDKPTHAPRWYKRPSVEKTSVEKKLV